jgi:hypothetical protein
MTDSDESPRNEGRQGGGSIRGRSRDHHRGRGHPEHGFTQRGGSPTMTWDANPNHSPWGGIGRGSPGFNQNRSPRGGRGGNNDETFIPREMFDHPPNTALHFFTGKECVWHSRWWSAT